MSLITRSRSIAAGLIAALAGKTPDRVFIDDVVEPTNETPKPSRKVKKTTLGLYKGGKHVRRVPTHIMQQYLDEAQAKRERKNAKRAREFGYV